MNKDIILDSIDEGVFTIDLDFRITSINRSASQIIGISKGDALGLFCRDIFHSDICEPNCIMKETFNSGRHISNRLANLVDANGETIPVSLNSAILKDDNGQIIGGVETFKDLSEIISLRKKLSEKYTFEDIVSVDNSMREIFSILPDLAESNSSVLIEGESGTGKELIARAIHNLSNRKNKPLVIVNCGAIPENLLESELFGYEPGAFTDAKKSKKGKIFAAEEGTLFLDEIGELPKTLQVKLLRFIQEKEYEPLGSTKILKSDVRIIAATNRDLEQEVKANNFRKDFYYRINVFSIKLPPLKERQDDIPILIETFVKKFNKLKGKNIMGVSDEVLSMLVNYDFPGNIRELENIIEHGFVLCKEYLIQKEHLPLHFRKSLKPFSLDSDLSLDDVQKKYLLEKLEKNDWNKTKTAEELKIDPSTLWRKMKRFNITKA